MSAAKKQPDQPSRPGLSIVYVPLADLRPFAGNPRRATPDGLDRLRKSIKAFGFTAPILAWRSPAGLEIVAGHQRVEAARAAGLEVVPVVVLPFADAETAHAYNVADNRLAEVVADWDYAPLADLLTELDTGAFPTDVLGWTPEEMEKLMTWTPNTIDPKLAGEAQYDETTCPKCGYKFKT